MENSDLNKKGNIDDTKVIYNANQDGTIELGDAIKSKSPTEIKEILEKSLKVNNWKVEYLEKNKGMYKYIIKKGDIDIKLNIYIANISWASRSNPQEYRRQLASDISRVGFEVIESEKEYTLLLGLYDKDKPVFVGWDKNNKDNNGKQNSIYVNISTIAEALRDGFSIDKDEKNHIVCAFLPEFIHFYVKYKNKIHSNKGFLDTYSITEYLPSEEGIDYGREQLNEGDSELKEYYNYIIEYNLEYINKIAMKRNRILSGAPGTGKSNRLDKDAKILNFEETKRVTFYPTYGYGQFIGTYKPSPIYSCPNNIEETLYEANCKDSIKEYRKPIIDYKLIAGPFLDILCKAINNEDKKYLLIIEEINRGDAASIFGDAFQLLDRNSKGESTYGIRFNEDIMNYIAKQGILDDQIKIPSNMYIWCTMNSADEGVKKLDSAFKRRWNFEYMHINGDEDSREYIESLEIKTKFNCLNSKSSDKKIKWDSFRQKLNALLLDKISIPEDKLIGPFFISKEEMNDEDVLVDKLVMYLREDVLRYKSSEFFGDKSFFQILDSYKEGDNIFSKVISDNELIDMISNKIDDINSNDEKTEGTYNDYIEDGTTDLEG